MVSQPNNDAPYYPSAEPVCMGCRQISGDELFTTNGQRWSWCDVCQALESIMDAGALLELRL